jgi:DNA invertase Pin-like site-specific DNA recombinase
MTRADATPQTRQVESPKISDAHRAKLAVVYVRQSTPQQVIENRESLARQYALADHACSLGWPTERVLVIDEDLGLSGRTADMRLGFQRLLAEVSMDHVGLVLGLEMSRLSRSCKDWHQLLELCGLFGALLADQDGVYDPSDPNDRLLLGLKGQISELELPSIRSRLVRGKLNKARRGELIINAPIGYVKTSAGGLALDPDEQVRAVVRLLFDKFEELGMRVVTIIDNVPIKIIDPQRQRGSLLKDRSVPLLIRGTERSCSLGQQRRCQPLGVRPSWPVCSSDSSTSPSRSFLTASKSRSLVRVSAWP